MYGQAVQPFPHIFIPLLSLFGLKLGWSATLALIRCCLRLDCLLYAVKGASGNTSAKYWFWLVIDLQCLVCMLFMAGNLGWYVMANTGLFVCLFFVTFLRANSLGTSLALSIALSTRLLGYFLNINISLSSFNLRSLSTGSLQTLIMRNAKEYGMFFVVWTGWQLLVRRYWFLSDFFLNRSTLILLFTMLSSWMCESWSI